MGFIVIVVLGFDDFLVGLTLLPLESKDPVFAPCTAPVFFKQATYSAELHSFPNLAFMSSQSVVFGHVGGLVGSYSIMEAVAVGRRKIGFVSTSTVGNASGSSCAEDVGSIPPSPLVRNVQAIPSLSYTSSPILIR